MNDTFYEQLIKRKAGIYDYIAIFIAISFIIMLAILSFLSLNPIFFIILLLLIFLSYYFKIPNTCIEFEYSMLNSEINVDIILSKSKRKQLRTFDVKSIKLLTLENSLELKPYLGIKKYNYSSNDPNVNTYILIISQNNQNYALMMDLDEKLLNMIKAYIPRSIKL